MHKTLRLDKLEGVDYKYDNSFWISSPKTQWSIFGTKFFAFFFVLDGYFILLKFHKFESTDWKFYNSFYQIAVQKYLDKVFLFLDETLHVNKFEDADFKFVSLCKESKTLPILKEPCLLNKTPFRMLELHKKRLIWNKLIKA